MIVSGVTGPDRYSPTASRNSRFLSPNAVYAGGNGAKRIRSALEASLRRLRTDYIDLYWIHVWDSVTPAEELLGTMAALVQSGKIRYWGISNTPAWYIAKLATLAITRGLPGPIALQYFYSLANRDIEDEFVPMAAEFGMGIVPWSPLAFGLLTGKYDRVSVESAAPRAGGLPKDAAQEGEQRPAGDKRLDGANPFGDSLFTERNWKILDTLKALADDTGLSQAQIALAWVSARAGVASTLMGVSRAGQIADNIAALDVALRPEHMQALDAVSAPEQKMLYSLFTPSMRQHAVLAAVRCVGPAPDWAERAVTFPSLCGRSRVPLQSPRRAVPW